MITRDVAAAARSEFDLVVVGGGIYGVSLLHEAAARGLSACLCEAGDFGSGTTWNSLRILHGGLRYLQTLNLRRFFQSVAARRRLARQFPSLVRPLKCLMPLYGQGLKRASVMRMALVVNDALSVHRNSRVIRAVHLPGGAIMDAEATLRLFPQARPDGLEGAAEWSDALLLSSERVVMELLLDSCRHGATALNYSPVIDIVSDGRTARGVLVQDLVTGERHSISGRAVFNCAGPQVRRLADGRGGATEGLFRPSLAFNVLLDRTIAAQAALAVAAPRPGAPTLFVLPQAETLLAGTMHVARPADTTEALPTEAELAAFLAELNAAIPGLDARLGDVCRVFAGLLPAARVNSSELAQREVFVDHGAAGGVDRLYSVSGVKLTTAWDVACQALAMIGGRATKADAGEPLHLAPWTEMAIDAAAFLDAVEPTAASALDTVIRNEAVLCVDDLVMRRVNWATTCASLDGIRARVARLASLPERPPGRLFEVGEH